MEDDAASDASEQEVPETTSFQWFHIGGKAHLVSFFNHGIPIPECAKDGKPFNSPVKEQWESWSDTLENRGVCPKCDMAW